MKRTTVSTTATIGLALVLAVTGCHRSPITTPMPGSMPPANPNASGITSGDRIPSEPPPNVSQNASGISASPDGLWNHPHKTDRQKFANDTVYFDFDSATIKPSEESKLQDLALYFKGSTTDALTIEGNCDERGTEKYNLSLGDRRALAVREYLANLGVDPMRIQTVTYGASKPVESGHNEEAWKKNRRDDFVLLQPQ